MVNHLIDQSSPYLQQHVENPVDWYPYSDEAFEKAKKEDKLIFLSIGYSACHWCHVMAHESFEDEVTAQFLNKHFVSIKVDREERPDIDHVYQTLTQAMGKQGGWPLSIFLTPHAKPFFAGTYFPKIARYGMISFQDLLKAILEKFENEQDSLYASSQDIQDALAEIYEKNILGASSYTESQKFQFPHDFSNILPHILRQFDEIDGGIAGAPKFPSFILLTFLLHQLVELQPDDPQKNRIEEAIENTLDHMLQGGIYDQIGGGFHRYSVDSHWLVPHFEKMLYDNAMALITYSEAFLYFRYERYKRVVKEIISWLEREMCHSSGIFYSSIDADVEHEEGLFYTWTFAEIQEHLSPEDFELAVFAFGISKEGNFEGNRSILTYQKTVNEISEKFDLPASEVSEKILQIKNQLMAIRSTRKSPMIDKKVILSWNSLVLHGLLAARKIFAKEPLGNQILAQVKGISAFFREKMVDSESGRLYRIYRNGHVKIPGVLPDYAYFIQALLDEYDATHEAEVLSTIQLLVEYTNHHFWDSNKNIYYYTENHTVDVPIRPIILFDNPLPNANSVMAENLLRYHYYFSSNEGLERADSLIKTLTPSAVRLPTNFGSLFLAIQCLVYGGTDIAIIHPDSFDEQKEGNIFRGIISDYYIPRLHIYEGRSCPKHPEHKVLENKATFYYCQAFNCKAPTTNLQEFRDILEQSFPRKI